MPNKTKSEWALDRHVEIRHDDKGELDEVVTYEAGMFHLERMSDSDVWMAIYHPEDLNDSRVVIRINAIKGEDGEPKLEMTLQVE